MANTGPTPSGTITSALRAGVTKTGADPADILDPQFLRQMTLIQNGFRGSAFEQMAQIALIATFDTTDMMAQVCFATPRGRRFVDLYLPTKRIAVEVKSGRICANRLTRSQISKDAHLLAHDPKVDRCIWMLFDGASPRALSLAKTAGIEVMTLPAPE